MDELPQAEPQTSPGSEAPAQGGRRVLPLIALVLTLVAGAGAGFGAVSRVLLPWRAGAQKQGEAKAPASAAPLYLIENLVVNPQGTKGGRFLIVSVAVQPRTAEVTEELKRLDPELRDAFGHTLAAKTVDDLSDIGRRDSLKQELKRATERVLGRQAIADIFLPQFVLQ